MLQNVIDDLGMACYRSMISPLKRASKFSGLVLGFDTEYESKGGKLICWQLSDGETSVLHTGRLTVAALARAIQRSFKVESGEEVLLVSYFSIAELQFLPVKTESFGWREYGGGSLDCSFHDEATALTLHVFDLARFFDKQSLAKVAEAFGLKKLVWKRDAITRADLKKKGFREYALNDAVLAAKIVAALREQFEPWGVDPLGEKTAAGTAAAVFRRGWVHSEIKCDENRARLAGMYACWGGRAEAFARGDFPRVYEYDLSSAYPRAAIDLGVMPCEGSWMEVRTLADMGRCRGGVAQIEFSFPPSERYPSLPVVLKTAQLYPLAGREWVTFEEVQAAREVGCKVKVLEAWGYRKGTTVLRDYMQEVLERRAQAKGAQRVAYKLLANALIGKLAQRVTSIDLNKMREAAEEHGILLDDVGSMNRDELKALGIEAAARVGAIFMPEWNALITGRVRARIGILARMTEAVYVATDAVWSTKKIAKPWPDLELKRHGAAVVARTRLGVIYDGEDPHVAHHSVWNRKAALELLGNMKAGPVRYSIRRPIKLRESMKTGGTFGEWIEEERIADSYWDDKRRLHDDGRGTSPWPDVGTYLDATKRARLARARAIRERARSDSGRASAQASSRHGRNRPKGRSR